VSGDRLPIVLVVLDGLGDRPLAELGGATPAEAAATPVLDALARRGASGLHLPFGWGRATTSEWAHWSLLGYEGLPFPGRAVLEGLGAGLEVAMGRPVVHAALRSSVERDGRLWVTGRAGPADADDAAALLASLAPATLDGIAVTLEPLGCGEAVLTLAGAGSAEVTDTDPFFPDLHPWMRPQALAEASDPAEARRTAAALERFLRGCRARLVDHPVNAGRRRRGVGALDLLTTKWAGSRDPLPSFEERTGLRGASVASTTLYAGIARLLGMATETLPHRADPREDMAARIDAARGRIVAGDTLVHVHTKATDEAGHSKRPHAKLEVLEAIDPGLEGLLDLCATAIVAVTGDHATPSSGGLLHSGDPTPLIVAGPTVRPDAVSRFGEEPAAAGAYGRLRAADVLPLLAGHANRPALLGHRPAPWTGAALPDRPEPMPPR
jgi:2,3-bisphosphoglycerate-independent phosphoglycerate mutase